MVLVTFKIQMGIKIAFHNTILDYRGTCSALFDYAKYNEDYLLNTSIILASNEGHNTHRHDPLVLKKFSNRFQVVFYTSTDEMRRMIQEMGVDVVYIIKYGKRNEIEHVFGGKVKTVIHCVFDMSDEHGDVYAGVSQQIAQKFNKTLFVPHIVQLPRNNNGDMRHAFNIPVDATVFGIHASDDTFNIPFVKKCLETLVNERNEAWCVFAGISAFCRHPKIIFLDAIVDPDEKVKFIRTCDIGIGASALGHSQGLSYLEFSYFFKPLLLNKDTCAVPVPFFNDNYITNFGDKADYYTTEDELHGLLLTKCIEKTKGVNCASRFSPSMVMEQFKRVFIDVL